MNRNRSLARSAMRVRSRLCRARGLVLAVLWYCIITSAAVAESDRAAPNWTVESAVRAASKVDAVARLRPLFALAQTGDDDALLTALQQLASDDVLPLPAREFMLQEFARGLSDLPARKPPQELVVWLLGWRPQTLVPHEESPAEGVPLYNVVAAAAGSFNAWERRLAAAQTPRLLDTSAEAWLAAWLEGGPAHRAGLVDALEHASRPHLRELAEAALAKLPSAPELGGATTRIALVLADPKLFSAAIASGSSNGLPHALRRARTVFDAAEQAAILEQTVHEAEPANAALAIAELGPGLIQRPEIEQLLFDLLGDIPLGAAASLALGRSPDPLVQARLDQLAASGQGLAAGRAGLARDVRESSRNPHAGMELQP
jgi:hypothetical protein